MATKALINLLKFAETSLFLVGLGLQLFGPSQKIMNFVQPPAIIIFYVATCIALFGQVFGGFQKSIEDKRHHGFKRFFTITSNFLSFVGRIVFEVVLVWTRVNAIQYHRARTEYFTFYLASVNFAIMILQVFYYFTSKYEPIHEKPE